MKRGRGLSPVRFKVATTPDDLEKVDRLWQEVYVKERGWLADSADAILCDRYHPHSVYLLACCEEEAVGTLRLVRDSAIGLPIEQFFPLGLLKENQRFAESQRLMVTSRYRRSSFEGAPYGMWAGLIKACVHYCFINSISHVFADVFTDTSNGPMVEQFRRLGFEQVGSAFQDTELSAPGYSLAMLLTFSQLLSRAYISREPLFEYLLQFDSAFDFYAPAARIAEPQTVGLPASGGTLIDVS